jgi:hypothetical protein
MSFQAGAEGRRRIAGHFLFLFLFSLLLPALVPLAGRTAEGAATPAPAPTGRLIPWAIDPEDPGEDLPPVGRSVFDFLVTVPRGGEKVYAVPFPFSALVERVKERLGGEEASLPLERVLIPLGRSLQRNAAAPHFFKAPRAVLAVVGDPGRPGALFLKDRLYLGYQETAGIVEVISYNETAGRFEFQVVRDYRPGGRPRVLYASRALCTACHQNSAPIFARQLWDETNANPRVAGLLRDEKRVFYGFPIDLGPDAPYAVQAAADRANRFALDQRLWREGCETGGERAVACRAALFTAALQYRLTGGRFDDRSLGFQKGFLDTFAAGVREHFPRGLAVPDPELPNRDPFAGVAGDAAGTQQASVPGNLTPEQTTLLGRLVLHSAIPASFEPLNPRPPEETWSSETPPERLISGLANFLSEREIRDLDAHLYQAGSAAGAPRRRLTADCRLAARRDEHQAIDRLKLDCHGGFELQGRIYMENGRVTGGEVERVTIEGRTELSDVAIPSGEITRRSGNTRAHLVLAQKTSGLHARTPEGDAVEAIEITWHEGQEPVLAGHVELTLLADFAAVDRAVDALARSTVAGASAAFSARPLRRSILLPALFANLGMKSDPTDLCCTDASGMPVAAVDSGAGGAGPEEAEAERLAQRFPEPALRTFFHYCATCHATAQTSPPNFLHGEPALVRANLARCAERIFFRLSMSQVPHDDRPKTAMPPVQALRRLHLDPAEWPGNPDLTLLRQHVADLLRGQTGAAPRLEDLTARGYENLRECLPGRP